MIRFSNKNNIGGTKYMKKGMQKRLALVLSIAMMLQPTVIAGGAELITIDNETAVTADIIKAGVADTLSYEEDVIVSDADDGKVLASDDDLQVDAVLEDNISVSSVEDILSIDNGDIIENDTLSVADAADDGVVLLANGNEESIVADSVLQDTIWQSDYEYRLTSNKIILEKYIGNSSDVKVPGYAVVGGVKYNTVLGGGVFRDCLVLGRVDLSELTTPGNSCERIFQGCTNLIVANLSGFNTTGATVMTCMFSGCSRLWDLDLTGMDTSSVTNMELMFAECENLDKLDLSSFNTSKVKTMMAMFQGCKILSEVDLSSFDTRNVEDMSGMFLNCESLEQIDVSSFDTSKVTTVLFMFQNCKKLTSINLSSFDLGNLGDKKGLSMFQGCDSLIHVYSPQILTQNSMLPWDETMDGMWVTEWDSIGGIYLLSSGEEMWVKRAKLKRVTNISLSYNKYNIKEGQSLRIIPVIKPENATDKSVTWVSSAPNIVEVNNAGRIIAKSVGKANLTVTSNDQGKSATCEVEVKKEVVTGVELNEHKLSLSVGGSDTLVAKVEPTDASDKGVTWSSDDETVATVDSEGTVTGKKIGTATIKVSTKDGGFEDSCEVTVENGKPVEGISVNLTSNTINVGDTFGIKYTIMPENASNKKVSWTSSDTSVATVDNFGVVIGKGAGKATVTVKTEDGEKTATCVVTVYKLEQSEDEDDEHFTCVRDETQTALTDNMNSPQSAWKYTNATLRYYPRNPAIAYTVRLEEMYIGNKAAEIVQYENFTSKKPSASQQWMLVKYSLKNRSNETLKASDVLYTGNSSFPTVYTRTGSSLKPDDIAFSKDRRGMGVFALELESGATGYVWIAMLLDKSVGYPYLRLSNGYDETNRKPKFVWLDTTPIKEVKPVPVTGVSVSPTSETIQPEDGFTITATVTPGNADNKAVSWKSSNFSVATVDSAGKVKGIKPGKADIIATTKDRGYTAICEVTVQSIPVEK